MNIFNKIKEVINFEITNVKKDILEYEHLTEFGDDFYKPGDCINHILNAKDVLSEYQKILDYDVYLMAISKDGVPYDLISKTIPVIEASVNEVLESMMVGFSVKLEMEGKNIAVRG